MLNNRISRSLTFCQRFGEWVGLGRGMVVEEGMRTLNPDVAWIHVPEFRQPDVRFEERPRIDSIYKIPSANLLISISISIYS